MLEDLAPSYRTYSDDPATQAFCAHAERWLLKAGASLCTQVADRRIGSLAVLQDFAWDAVLDFIVPLEASARDALKRAGTGLPWETRLDIQLYWRLMYAAHVETLADRQVPGQARGGPRRPIHHAVSALTLIVGQLTKPEGGSDPHFLTALFAPGASPIGHAIYQGIVDRAGYQIGLRSGTRRTQKPLGFAARVRAGNVAAIIEGCGFDGSVTLSRETEPDDAGGLAWKLDAAIGRWTATAWPWQFTGLP